jgi:aryl-alcohol dehydrogenase-like predicted oxidoreductase
LGSLVSSERVKQWDISVLTLLSGVEMTRVHTLEDTTAILDTFQKHGHNEVDSARVYGEGSSEEYLGNPGCFGAGNFGRQIASTGNFGY